VTVRAGTIGPVAAPQESADALLPVLVAGWKRLEHAASACLAPALQTATGRVVGERDELAPASIGQIAWLSQPDVAESITDRRASSQRLAAVGIARPYDRLGSKTRPLRQRPHVSFRRVRTWRRVGSGQRCARNRLMQRNKAPLFHRLVGRLQEWLRDDEAKRLRNLETPSFEL
jgi:hypothetical protein